MQKIIGLIHTRFSPMGGVKNYINKLVPDLLNRNWQVHCKLYKRNVWGRYEFWKKYQ